MGIETESGIVVRATCNIYRQIKGSWQARTIMPYSALEVSDPCWTRSDWT